LKTRKSKREHIQALMKAIILSSCCSSTFAFLNGDAFDQYLLLDHPFTPGIKMHFCQSSHKWMTLNTGINGV